MSGKARQEATIDRGVLLKGIPFEAKINDIVMFFKSVAIDKDNIHIIKSMDGSSTGLAFVRMDDEEEIKRALLMDRNHMGSRYIEVRMSDESELYYLMLRARAGMTRNELYRISGHGDQKYPVYKELDTKFAYIAGVPQGSQYKEIRNFFAGRLIGRGKIWLLREGSSGQFRGDGYIEFANPDECLMALKNSGSMMGNSVIRVEPCEMEEAEEFSEGNLGHGAGGRDVDYRQSRGGYDTGSWDSAVGRGRRDREVNNRSSGDRYVSRSHRRTPSPARRRREMYTATYGNNTLLREDLFGEPILDGAGPYDPHIHPNGSSHYGSGSNHSGQYGGSFGTGGSALNHHHPSDSGSTSYRSGGQGIDSYMSSVYGGHATVARQPEKKYSPLFPDSLSQAGTSRPLMSLMGGSGSGSGSVGGVGGSSERRVVRVEGLPYHVNVPQILEFFRGYDVGYDQVRIQCRDDGSPSGKAFISFPSERHARLASEQLNKRYIGDRYVELFLV